MCSLHYRVDSILIKHSLQPLSSFRGAAHLCWESTYEGYANFLFKTNSVSPITPENSGDWKNSIIDVLYTFNLPNVMQASAGEFLVCKKFHRDFSTCSMTLYNSLSNSVVWGTQYYASTQLHLNPNYSTVAPRDMEYLLMEVLTAGSQFFPSALETSIKTRVQRFILYYRMKFHHIPPPIIVTQLRIIMLILMEDNSIINRDCIYHSFSTPFFKKFIASINSKYTEIEKIILEELKENHQELNPFAPLPTITELNDENLEEFITCSREFSLLQKSSPTFIVSYQKYFQTLNKMIDGLKYKAI